ncbi:Type I restriction enzyme R protein N terminus (HSDR_N) [Desulfocicer vacuolatum DSM 3385]|uniref:Type I restriction enzyme R protein N terminus (HSDR_N) n=1 Tax=Desulfocicer vacuolatum DSM 3385 TaxID=1121400 RepID=A0A1W2DA75_9BACT|nr:type I restriction enzyme HsdR N-terminal domain-containing protein [Desulfocicer vacuolatum]SMC94401.1 Type I restriction enzyme R protein N terminus (HSDR_N) [Desulfocicer vacuolatum DSM 3385]
MEDILIDYVTGKPVPNVGPEGSRQLFEKILVETKGFSKKEIRVDEPITVMFQNQTYESTLDLVVFCDERPFMAVRCIAGSLGSYEREILAGARLIYDHQIPFSVATNGKDALVRNVITGKPHGEGMDTVPTREWAKEQIKEMKKIPFPEGKKEREMILFRSYNMEKYENECDGLT